MSKADVQRLMKDNSHMAARYARRNAQAQMHNTPAIAIELDSHETEGKAERWTYAGLACAA